MSEDSKANAEAEKFVLEVRELESKHCIKYGFALKDGDKFLPTLIKNLDANALRYKNNKEFIKGVLGLMKKALAPPDGNVKAKPYQKLRKEYLEFFEKFPWFEDLKAHTLEFFEILQEIVMTDYHTNAGKALRIIYNMNKYFKNIIIKFSHYSKLLNFFLDMLTHFDKAIESTFFFGEYKSELSKMQLIEKASSMEKDSRLSLSLINEFMDLIIFLDQLYKDDPEQLDFFKKLKEPLIFIVAKSYDSKWLKFFHQTKEFFTLKNCMIFLINQYLNNAESYQCE